jgi:hypothetical protein
MEKKSKITEESKEFFREVFRYDFKKRIDFAGILNLKFITQIPTYQAEVNIYIQKYNKVKFS